VRKGKTSARITSARTTGSSRSDALRVGGCPEDDDPEGRGPGRLRPAEEHDDAGGDEPLEIRHVSGDRVALRIGEAVGQHGRTARLESVEELGHRTLLTPAAGVDTPSAAPV
jgi:hypothetical protein